jgi:hypothetical protein
MKKIRIGAGAGYAGDRIDPAVELAEKGDIRYLCLDCLAERTIAIAQLDKRRDPAAGYGQLLRERMQAILPYCARGLVMVSNMGAANPPAALKTTVEVAEAVGAANLKIAAVTGDDVLEKIAGSQSLVWESGLPVREYRDRIISANAYLGIEAIVPCLRAGCNVVLTGRVADPALFLAPLAHEFGWASDDWARLGAGTAVGHLLECAGQATGGFFAEPGLKDVPDLSRLGFPLAEVAADGTAVITKVPGSGGLVSRRTCKEQLLYEIHDPAAYFTPDVTADFSRIEFIDDGTDRVLVRGASGGPRPETLKVSLGIQEGYIGEGEISFAGQGAYERARLAAQIVSDRLRMRAVPLSDTRMEVIGYDSILGPISERNSMKPLDARLRVAVKADDSRSAAIAGEEVEALYLNGPAGAAGARKSVRPVIAVYSSTIEREKIEIKIQTAEVK